MILWTKRTLKKTKSMNSGTYSTHLHIPPASTTSLFPKTGELMGQALDFVLTLNSFNKVSESLGSVRK